MGKYFVRCNLKDVTFSFSGWYLQCQSCFASLKCLISNEVLTSLIDWKIIYPQGKSTYILWFMSGTFWTSYFPWSITYTKAWNWRMDTHFVMTRFGYPNGFAYVFKLSLKVTWYEFKKVPNGWVFSIVFILSSCSPRCAICENEQNAPIGGALLGPSSDGHVPHRASLSLSWRRRRRAADFTRWCS